MTKKTNTSHTNLPLSFVPSFLRSFPSFFPSFFLSKVCEWKHQRAYLSLPRSAMRTRWCIASSHRTKTRQNRCTQSFHFSQLEALSSVPLDVQVKDSWISTSFVEYWIASFGFFERFFELEWLVANFFLVMQIFQGGAETDHITLLIAVSVYVPVCVCAGVYVDSIGTVAGAEGVCWGVHTGPYLAERSI